MEPGSLLVPPAAFVPESRSSDVTIMIRRNPQPTLDHEVSGNVAPGQAQTSFHLICVEWKCSHSPGDKPTRGVPVLGTVALAPLSCPSFLAPEPPWCPTSGEKLPITPAKRWPCHASPDTCPAVKGVRSGCDPQRPRMVPGWSRHTRKTSLMAESGSGRRLPSQGAPRAGAAPGEPGCTGPAPWARLTRMQLCQCGPRSAPPPTSWARVSAHCPTSSFSPGPGSPAVLMALTQGGTGFLSKAAAGLEGGSPRPTHKEAALPSRGRGGGDAGGYTQATCLCTLGPLPRDTAKSSLEATGPILLLTPTLPAVATLRPPAPLRIRSKVPVGGHRI